MLRLSEIKLPLDHSEADLSLAVAERLGLVEQDLLELTVFKRSYDARKKHNILLIYQVDVVLSEVNEKAVLEKFSSQPTVRIAPDTRYQFVAQAQPDFPAVEQQRPIIIGFGPCGLLAALLLAQMGLKPIVLERGAEVRQRTKDTWDLWRKGKLNTESNVQFGEGGAGTFSDGKLYSQVKDKRHLGRKVLEEFVKAGAPEEILVLSKPHIGTFKLVKMVETMRDEILRLGGEIRFGVKVEILHREAGSGDGAEGGADGVTVAGVSLKNGETLERRHVVLAEVHRRVLYNS